MTDIYKLLEQHGHYDLGDGFTIARGRKGVWHVYWKGMHEQCHQAVFLDLPIPTEVTGYSSAANAFWAAGAILKCEQWYRVAKAKIEAEREAAETQQLTDEAGKAK